MAKPTITNIAVFCDFENVALGVRDAKYARFDIGKVLERPWVRDGEIMVRQTLRVTLSADHRASVGHRGALYLAALERLLLEPEKLS